jgi:catechol 2,3-dioxygenase-like lactoylglutathione lyase family enzyme
LSYRCRVWLYRTERNREGVKPKVRLLPFSVIWSSPTQAFQLFWPVRTDARIMSAMRRLALLIFLATVAITSSTAEGVKRPRILGVAHMALYVSDLQKSRAFYKDFLGFDEPYLLKREDGSDRIVFIKVNEDQYIELFAEPSPQAGHLNHIAFLTDSAEGMRIFLGANGVKVPEKVGTGRIGNSNFNVVDPDGHTVEIVQYKADSWTLREKGKFIPETRISTRIMHLGVLVRSLDPAMKFYGDILGFKEFWRGSSNGTELSWVNMRVPDSQDYLELMLYSQPQNEEQMGGKNHICLITPDIQKAVTLLEARPGRKNYGRTIEIKIGKNGKRQANLYDPDGTRIELMEPNTADGKPVPSSTAPPPVK